MVASRAMFEVMTDRAEAARYQANLLKRLDELGLDEELDPAERTMLRGGIGSLDKPTVIRGTWRYEGAAVLAWSLGRLELPPIDEQVSDGAVGDVFFDLNFDSSAALSLRPPDVISDYEMLMYNLNWRTNHFRSHPGRYDLRAMLADAPDLPGVPPLHLLENDLAVGDAPIFRAPPDAVESVQSVVRERRWAASWLIGDHPRYGNVSLDT